MSAATQQSKSEMAPDVFEPFNALIVSRISGHPRGQIGVISIDDTVDAIREGVDGSVVKEMAEYMPKSILVSVLGTDASNLAKIYKKRLSRHQTNEINELSLLWEELNAFFNRDHKTINEWISKPMKALEGKSPAEIMDSGFGRQKIKECLDIMRFGDFA